MSVITNTIEERLAGSGVTIDGLLVQDGGLPGLEASWRPPGEITMFGSTTPPTGWLLCDGMAVSRSTYAMLFAAIGTSYGPGDGTLTFNLPNFNGFFPTGGGEIGVTGGSDTMTLGLEHMPDHTHTLRVSDQTSDEQSPVGAVAGFEAAGATFVYRKLDGPNADAHPDAIAPTVGGGESFSIVPPYLCVSFIIKT